MQTRQTLRTVSAYSSEPPTTTDHDPLVRLDVLQVASAQSAACALKLKAVAEAAIFRGEKAKTKTPFSLGQMPVQQRSHNRLIEKLLVRPLAR